MTRSILPMILIVALVGVLVGCESNIVGSSAPDLDQKSTSGPAEARGIIPGQATIVEVVARHEGDDYVFDLSHDEVPSGWVTFRLVNESHSSHFVYTASVPQAAIDGAREDGVDLLDYWVAHITNPFQFFWDDEMEGKEPRMEDLPTKYMDSFFPPWFEQAMPAGGPGLTSGMTTSETTVYLDPGVYVVECYVKNADNDFHSYLGMIELLTVTEARSASREPSATAHVSVSTGGIVAEGDMRPGMHTVEVTFENQAIYDHLLGHDVHLIRLEDGTTLDDVSSWMNWRDPDGLVSSSHAGLGPQTFLGGAQTILTPGLFTGESTSTSYVHVNLKPGRYAWVAEIPNPTVDNGFLVPFTVASNSRLAGR